MEALPDRAARAGAHVDRDARHRHRRLVGGLSPAGRRAHAHGGRARVPPHPRGVEPGVEGRAHRLRADGRVARRRALRRRPVDRSGARAHAGDRARAGARALRRQRHVHAPEGGEAMRRVREAWRAWVALLDRREAPTSLALTRILVAAVILGDLLQARLHGVVAAVWAPPPYGIGVGAVWDREPPWSIRWFGASVDTAELLWWVAVIAAALLLLGAASRLAAIVLVLVLAQMAHIAPDGDRGIDLLLRA